MPKSSLKELKEYRRLEAVRLLEQGWKQKKVAEFLEVSQGSVSNWRRKYEASGKEGLKAKRQTGKPPRLNETQKEQLKVFLDQGATACGFEGDFWTHKRVSRLVLEKFDVILKPRMCGYLLKALGYVLKKPQLRSYQQKPEKVLEWKKEKIPEIKKKPKNEML